MAQTQIGFGIIGTGNIARNHARAIGLCESGKLVSVFDTVAQRAEDFAKQYGAY